MLQLALSAVRAESPKDFRKRLTALRLMLGSWRAAAEAAVADHTLLQLPGNIVDWKRMVFELNAAKYSPTQRLKLIWSLHRCTANKPAFPRSLHLLQLMLSSWMAAADAVLADSNLARLPESRYMQVGTWQLPAACATHNSRASCSIMHQ